MFNEEYDLVELSFGFSNQEITVIEQQAENSPTLWEGGSEGELG